MSRKNHLISYLQKRYCTVGASESGNANAMSLIDCVDDLSAANVDRHMVDASAPSVEYQISGLNVSDGNSCAGPRLGTGGSGKSDTEVGIYTSGKAGAVSTVSQAVSAINVRISDKLLCICNNRASSGVGNCLSGSFRFLLSGSLRLLLCRC